MLSAEHLLFILCISHIKPSTAFRCFATQPGNREGKQHYKNYTKMNMYSRGHNCIIPDDDFSPYMCAAFFAHACPPPPRGTYCPLKLTAYLKAVVGTLRKGCLRPSSHHESGAWHTVLRDLSRTSFSVVFVVIMYACTVYPE
jgi:hypothetical protein